MSGLPILVSCWGAEASSAGGAGGGEAPCSAAREPGPPQRAVILAVVGSQLLAVWTQHELA